MPNNHSLSVNATCNNGDEEDGINFKKIAIKWGAIMQAYMYVIGNLSGALQQSPPSAQPIPPNVEWVRGNPIEIVIINVITNVKKGYVSHIDLTSNVVKSFRSTQPPQPQSSPTLSSSPCPTPCPSPSPTATPTRIKTSTPFDPARQGSRKDHDCRETYIGCEKYDIPDWPIK